MKPGKDNGVAHLRVYVCAHLCPWACRYVACLDFLALSVELEQRCGWHTSVHQPLKAWKEQSNILFKGKYGGAAGKQTLGKQNKKENCRTQT